MTSASASPSTGSRQRRQSPPTARVTVPVATTRPLEATRARRSTSISAPGGHLGRRDGQAVEHDRRRGTGWRVPEVPQQLGRRPPASGRAAAHGHAVVLSRRTPSSWRTNVVGRSSSSSASSSRPASGGGRQRWRQVERASSSAAGLAEQVGALQLLAARRRPASSCARARSRSWPASGRRSPRPRGAGGGPRPRRCRRSGRPGPRPPSRPRCAAPCARPGSRAWSRISSPSWRTRARYSSRSLSSQRAARSSSGRRAMASSSSSSTSSLVIIDDADSGTGRAASMMSRSCSRTSSVSARWYCGRDRRRRQVGQLVERRSSKSLTCGTSPRGAWPPAAGPWPRRRRRSGRSRGSASRRGTSGPTPTG